MIESNSVLSDINKQKLKIEKLKSEVGECEKQLASLEEARKRDEEERLSLKKSIKRLEADVQKISEFAKEDAEIKAQSKAIKEVKKQIDNMESFISSIETEEKRLVQKELEDEKLFARWKLSLEDKMSAVLTVIPDAYVDYSKRDNVQAEFLPEYTLDDPEEIFTYAQRRMDLNSEIESRNAQIKIYEEKLNRVIAEIKSYEDKLSRLMPGWRQIEIPSKSREELKNGLLELESAINALQGKVNVLEKQLEEVKGILKQLKNTISKTRMKIEEAMPSDEEDILVLLKDYFIKSINKIVEKNLQPEEIDDRMLDELMGDRVLFSNALGGRYPTLMVYKMTEKNEFRYSRPHDYYYASWEALNRGEEGSAEGSGGQKLSISTFMMMMLISYKKRSVAGIQPWTVLLMDNPFGQASAKHILDPIFEIADRLNFQIIAFAPPEIVKIEISKRFPIFWEIRLKGDESKNSSIVESCLVHGGRKLMDVKSVGRCL